VSGILGRIHFDDSPIDPDAFMAAFAALSMYGGDASELWHGDDAAFGAHLLHFTPESVHETLPLQRDDLVLPLPCGGAIALFQGSYQTIGPVRPAADCPGDQNPRQGEIVPGRHQKPRIGHD